MCTRIDRIAKISSVYNYTSIKLPIQKILGFSKPLHPPPPPKKKNNIQKPKKGGPWTRDTKFKQPYVSKRTKERLAEYTKNSVVQ